MRSSCRRGVRPLVYSVRLELVVYEVVLGLASLPADVALGPGVGRGQVGVDVFDVLTEVARG